MELEKPLYALVADLNHGPGGAQRTNPRYLRTESVLMYN